MTPAVDQAVQRATMRPLPHHLCKGCNPARKRPFVGTCPGCGEAKRDRMVFHVDGGAKAGGVTLTARNSDREAATLEANEHFGGRVLGSGRWVPRAVPTGPDCDGNFYWHHDREGGR